MLKTIPIIDPAGSTEQRPVLTIPAVWKPQPAQLPKK